MLPTSRPSVSLPAFPPIKNDSLDRHFHKALLMSSFQISFDLRKYVDLDGFALLACQPYNLGDAGNWFLNFRFGQTGFQARLFGVATHYYQVHSWLPSPRSQVDNEYQVASILFNMDSSIECLVFMMNALGWAQSHGDFRDVTDATQLKRITLRDILGGPGSALAGYAKFFPTVQDLWLSKKPVIDGIIENHDVSKHRRSVYMGGMAAMEPPSGFYESLGIPNDPFIRSRYWPMAEIGLMQNPKDPLINLFTNRGGSQSLEAMVDEFVKLIDDTGTALLDDVKMTMPLPEPTLRQ